MSINVGTTAITEFNKKIPISNLNSRAGARFTEPGSTTKRSTSSESRALLGSLFTRVARFSNFLNKMSAETSGSGNAEVGSVQLMHNRFQLRQAQIHPTN